MKIKTFWVDRYIDTGETEIQEWLDKNPNLTIIAMVAIEGDTRRSKVLVIYTSKL